MAIKKSRPDTSRVLTVATTQDAQVHFRSAGDIISPRVFLLDNPHLANVTFGNTEVLRFYKKQPDVAHGSRAERLTERGQWGKR
jgi:hypothetical protein